MITGYNGLMPTEKQLKIGVSRPPLSQPPPPRDLNIATLAKAAETLGFESFWCGDHPVDPVFRTPTEHHALADFESQARATGEVMRRVAGYQDPLIGLTAAAAVTETIKLGTGIILVPERNPILLAKQIASLDHYSNGRFLLGIGGGWNRESTTIMGGDFDHRWTQTREAVLAMKELWTKDEAEFHGRYYDFPPLTCLPHPVSKPHPPVFLGSEAKNVLKRVVDYGDGWIPYSLTPEQVREGRATLDALAHEAGRSPQSIELSVMVSQIDLERQSDAIMERYLESGADRVVILPGYIANDADTIGNMETLARRFFR
jgi:probable F420-dependent oxidoreductase